MTKEPMHLFRGAPAVRSWSKYQKTVRKWALCGVERRMRKGILIPPCTETLAEVTCYACLLLADVITQDEFSYHRPTPDELRERLAKRD